MILQLEGVETYYGQVKALKGVSLYVDEGETVTLLGANGAGKTTLLRTITGLNKVSSGRVLFEGRDIGNMKPHHINHLGISMSPEGRQVFANFSVRENLEAGAYALKDSRLKAELMEMIFSEFPILRERIGQMAGTLSGGEQQMLAIGRALMSNPRILLLDEPSLGLAPIIVEQIFDILSRIKATGKTILLVEQNANAALKLADRGYILETGRISSGNSAAELISNDEVRNKYLGA
jgi:branched-chain amino acid transport system ATP-binding protein